MTEHLRRDLTDGVLTLTLDRVDKKNALTEAMYAALSDGLEQAESDPAVRVVLLRAEGESFTAGNDLGDFAKVAMTGENPVQVTRFLRALAHASKPLVAAVRGRAVGVGTTLLLHCDLVLLAEDALLTTPFVGLALVPEAASSLLLPARIGHARAYAMFALGEAMGAAEAVACGLANKALPAEQLDAVARDTARRLASQPAGALAATKRLMRDAGVIAGVMETESAQFLNRLRSPEAREAFQAFAERRAPDFSKFG
ncbi:MAG: enoyl-CoA hydratase/isomerase family protein [Sphingomonadales bacterium]|nr:enoyl-CoA hydratase/isomerase family protein [Sphingomonadales bacterium]